MFLIDRDTLEDYVNVQYEVIKLREMLGLERSKATIYQEYESRIKKLTLQRDIFRISTEVLSISLLGVVSGVVIYSILQNNLSIR
jgi:uncharacterized protein YjcR